MLKNTFGEKPKWDESGNWDSHAHTLLMLCIK